MIKDDIDELYIESIGRSKLKRYILLAFITAMLGAAGYFIYLSNSPGDGQVISQAPSNPVVVKPKKLDAAYYSFSYPSNFTEEFGMPKGAGQLDLHIIKKRSARDNPDSMRVSLGIENLPAGGVTQMSPYLLAVAQPENYKITTKPCDTETCHFLYRYSDGGSEIMLWPHNNQVLMVAMSTQAAGTPPSYDELAAQIIKTLQWKQ